MAQYFEIYRTKPKAMRNSTIKFRTICLHRLFRLALAVFFLSNIQKAHAQCPVATATPSSQTICTCTADFIALSSNIPGTTFSWTVMQTGVLGAAPGTGTSILQTLCLNGNSTGTAIYTITPVANGCTGSPINDTITVTLLDNASFVYTSATYCQTGANPTPVITGLPGGTFSFTPTGLSMDPLTGLINLSACVPGTYSVCYLTIGSCPNTSCINITITTAPSANFIYSNSMYCQNASNPSPVFGTGASAGIFRATPIGLVFVHVNTGQINLASSTPGTYTITDTIYANGGCTATSSTTSVTISNMDDASFNYLLSIYSQTGTNPIPQITGLLGGTFSATPSGLVMNPTTGKIILSASALGTYTICYSTNGVCPNTSCATIIINNTVSVNENKLVGKLSIYPNPSNGLFYVKLPQVMNGSEINIKVFNLLGEILLNTKTNNNLSQIDLSKEPNGVYIIRVNDSNQAYNQRLIKQ